MGKTTAQKGANVVKDGARLKDVYATAVGDITKAYFCPERSSNFREIDLEEDGRHETLLAASEPGGDDFEAILGSRVGQGCQGCQG